MAIIVDSREASKHPEIPKTLSKTFEVEIRPLPAADILIVGKEKSMAIERKTVWDFLGSLRGKGKRSLFTQLQLMKECYDLESTELRLLVEGWIGVIHKTKWQPASVYSLMDSIISAWQVGIIFTAHIRDTLTYVAAMAKKLGQPKEKRLHPIYNKPKALTLQDRALIIVQSLPGISAKRSVDLLKHFRTVRNLIINAERINEVPGIGDKTRDLIVQVLDTPFKVDGDGDS